MFMSKQVISLNQASFHIALFLEYVPQNLPSPGVKPPDLSVGSVSDQWLGAQIDTRGVVAETAVTFVDKNLKATNKHMNSHDLVHFDAHFRNRLTDVDLLYFSDFGLLLSSKFDLTPAETEFLKHHQNYDQSCAIVNSLHCIITSLFGKEQWETHLHEYIRAEQDNSLPNISLLIKRYATAVLIMDEFFQHGHL